MHSFEVVAPVFNEAESLSLFVQEVKAALLQTKEIELTSIVLVDDGSSDASWRQIQELAASHREVRGIRFTRNFGKEAAVRAGLEATIGDYVLVIDADLQHPPSLIPVMIEKMRGTRCEVVSAVRTGFKESGKWRNIGSAIYNRIFSVLAGLDLAGATDFKLLSRNSVDRYCQLKERRLFFRGLTQWLAMHEEKVEFEVPAQNAAGSSWSLSSLVRYAIRNTTAFSTTPLQMVLWMGVLSLLFSIALTTQTLVNKLAGNASEGFTTIIIAVSFFGGLTLLALGIVGIYIAALYDEVKCRPIFLVAERTDEC